MPSWSVLSHTAIIILCKTLTAYSSIKVCKKQPRWCRTHEIWHTVLAIFIRLSSALYDFRLSCAHLRNHKIVILLSEMSGRPTSVSFFSQFSICLLTVTCQLFPRPSTIFYTKKRAPLPSSKINVDNHRLKLENQLKRKTHNWQSVCVSVLSRILGVFTNNKEIWPVNISTK